MNWDAMAAIGQAVSALALVFVLVQLRHARQEVRRSVSQARADAGRELWMLRADNPQLSGLILRAETTPSGHASLMEELATEANITLEEASQVFSHHFAWWLYQSQVIRFARELQEGERAQFDWSLRRYYGISHSGQIWFRAMRNILDPEAVRYVDNLLAQPG